MAIKITELPELLGDYNLSDLLIIYDVLQEKTSTIRASVFKGRGSYSSPLFPNPLVPLPSAGAYYVDGDLYYHTPDARINVYRFTTALGFVLLMQLRQPSKYSESNRPVGLGANLVLTANTYKDDDFFITGDYFSEGDRQYGPYVGDTHNALGVLTTVGTGFDLTYLGGEYNIIRGNRTFYGTAAITTLLVDNIVLTPLTGDRYVRDTGTKLEEYIYDKADEAGATEQASKVAGWGAFTYINPSKFHEATTLPVQDDTIYTAGDYFIFNGTGGIRLLYGPYIEGQATDDLAWQRAQHSVMNGTRVHELGAVPLTVNDVDYLEGDWGLHTDSGVRYMYGPYAQGNAGSVDLAWNSTSRVVVSGNRIFTLAVIPIADDSYIEGDYAVVTLDNRVWMYGPYTAGAWPTRVSLEGDTVHSVTAELAVDNTLYKDGDYQLVNDSTNLNIYLLGPYNLAGTSWGDRTNLRAPRIFQGAVAANVYQPPNGTTVVDGDSYIRTISATKRVQYGPYSDTVAYTNFGALITTNPDGVRWATISSPTVPDADDAIHSSGDYTITDIGNIYGPYVEGQITDILAWPLAVDIKAISDASNGAAPIGSVLDWFGQTYSLPTPSGWQLCDGSLITNLASTLAGQNTPDLRGRVTAVADATFPYGTTAGDWSTNISVANLPIDRIALNAQSIVISDDFSVVNYSGTHTSGTQSANHTHNTSGVNASGTASSNSNNTSAKIPFANTSWDYDTASALSGSGNRYPHVGDSNGISDVTWGHEHSVTVSVPSTTSGSNSANHTHSTSINHGHTLSGSATLNVAGSDFRLNGVQVALDIRQPTFYCDKIIRIF